MSKIVTLDVAAIRLKRVIRRHLRSLGFSKANDGRLVPPDLSKETYRQLHQAHRSQKFEKNEQFLADRGAALLKHFASGTEVDPNQVSAKLELVLPGTEEAELFRFASLYWSIPVSEGYGRRLRFLVRDGRNDKLIGLMGLGDPVFNLRVRDNAIGWDHKQRAKALVNVLDAFVLGAVPPYSGLLGGKLVAALIRSSEVAATFKQKYGDSRGIISKKRKNPRLVLVTTTSALGRSSIYNRLVLNGQPYFKSVGFTEGWGHFHIPDSLFEEMRRYLKARKDKYFKNNRFGQGPSWRLRAIRQTFHLLGLGEETIHHGLQREVFLCCLADNAFQFLRQEHRRPRYRSLLSADEISRLAIERWIAPRALRRPEYKDWTRTQFLSSLITRSSGVALDRCSNVSSS